MSDFTITTPNQKFQIVIPKKMREEMSINHGSLLKIEYKAGTLVVTVVKEIIDSSEKNAELLMLLEKSKGIGKNDPAFTNEAMKNRRKIELAASKRNKKAW